VPSKIGAASIRPRRDPNRLFRLCDPPPTLELREPHLLLQDMAPQLCDLGGKKGARSQRSVAFGLEGRDGLRGLCREVVASGRDGDNRTRLQILDPGPGRVQPLPLLAFLRDGDRQRLLGSVERPGSIAHLLVEDRQGILIGDLLTDRGDASANQRNQGCLLPLSSDFLPRVIEARAGA
jgi:hypothetical protein